MRPGASLTRIAVAAASAALLLSACSTVVDGHPSVANAPNAAIKVIGDSGSQFDTTVKNAISDILEFWTVQYPKVSGGKTFEPLKGGLYSVDGLKVAETKRVDGPAATEGCIAKNPTFIVDNGAFCLLDDSIAWDRAPTHLFAKLAHKYGPLMVALIFAHEVGHAISYRLGVFDQHRPTIDTESQADCAAGAWAASALKGEPAALPRRHPGRSSTRPSRGSSTAGTERPNTPQDISHGNGFDRLSAVADGIDKGVTYCFSNGYFNSRTYTERPFSSDARTTAPVTTRRSPTSCPPTPTCSPDLNRFWTATAQDDRQDVQAGQDRRGRPPEVRPTRRDRVRLLPRRQHRLLQPDVRPAGLQQPSRLNGRPDDRQRHPARRPAGRLRARRAVLDRLGHGRAAPAVRPRPRRQAALARRRLLHRRVRQGRQRRGRTRRHRQADHRCRPPISTKRRPRCSTRSAEPNPSAPAARPGSTASRRS